MCGELEHADPSSLLAAVFSYVQEIVDKTNRMEQHKPKKPPSLSGEKVTIYIVSNLSN